MIEFQYFCNVCEKIFPIQTLTTVKDVVCPYCKNAEQAELKLLNCKASSVIKVPKK